MSETQESWYGFNFKNKETVYLRSYPLDGQQNNLQKNVGGLEHSITGN